MTGPRHRFVAYQQYAMIGAREMMAYRGNFLWSLIGLAVQILLLSLVWRAVYDGRDQVDGVDLPTMVAYVTLANIQLWVVMTASYNLLPHRVRDGKIAMDLCRPVGVFEQVLAGQVGRMVAILPFGLIAVPLGMLAGELRPPASAVAAGGYVVSLTLAFGIAVLADTVIAMTVFWTMEARGIQFIYRNIAQFLAGGLVPLWFMPDWLRAVAEALPFQAMTYTPVSVYLGRLTGPDLARALAVQALWLAGVYLLGRLVWRRALHKVVIQGG